MIWRIVVGLLLLASGMVAALVIYVFGHIDFSPDKAVRVWPALVLAGTGAAVLLSLIFW